MNKPKSISFQTIIQTDDKMDVTFINIDFNVEEVFGKKRLKVKVWYDDVLYRGLLTKYAGKYFMIINKEIRAQLNKKAGDSIFVKIEEDLEERIVDLPEILVDFFKKEKALKTIYDKLSYTHQKEYVNWITSAKKEETLQNRLLKLKALLLEKQKK